MKKALSLILALVLCLSLCACGGNEPKKALKDTVLGTWSGSDEYGHSIVMTLYPGGTTDYKMDDDNWAATWEITDDIINILRNSLKTGYAYHEDTDTLVSVDGKTIFERIE
jgi:hypothetical protein